LAVVLFLSDFRKFPQLHFCQFVETAPDGLGRICSAVLVFFHFPDIELSGSGGGVLAISFIGLVETFEHLVLPSVYRDRHEFSSY
jgi:hypothetical protein